MNERFSPERKKGQVKDTPREAAAEKQPKYEILDDPEIREKIKERASRLVENIHNRGIDSLVFLDKSARPLAWLVRRMWQEKYGSEKNPKRETPQIHFANIGTEEESVTPLSKIRHLNIGSSSDKKMRKMEKRLEECEDNDEWLTSEEVESEFPELLDTENIINGSKPIDIITKELQSIYKDQFTGKRILIIDDIAATGLTTITAHSLWQNAFGSKDNPKKSTSINSTCFYKEAKYKGKKYGWLPWLQKQGLTGVLEVEEGKLLASASNPENIYKLKLEHQEEYEEQISHMLNLAKRIIDGYKTAIDHYKDEDNEMMITLLESNQEEIDYFLKTRDINSVDPGIMEEICKCIPNMMGKSEAETRVINFFYLIKEFHTYIPETRRIKDILDSLNNPDELQRKHLQLRSEIDQLAREAA